MMLISNYHEFKTEEFKLIVISEDDEYYYVQHLPEDYHKFQEGSSIDKLRNLLVGEHGIYKILEDHKYVQLSLFD